MSVSCKCSRTCVRRTVDQKPHDKHVLWDVPSLFETIVYGPTNRSAPLRVSLFIFTFPLWNVVNNNTSPCKYSSLVLHWYSSWLTLLESRQDPCLRQDCFWRLLVVSLFLKSHIDLLETPGETSRFLAGPGGDGLIDDPRPACDLVLSQLPSLCLLFTL